MPCKEGKKGLLAKAIKQRRTKGKSKKGGSYA